MRALGKPVFGYSASAAHYADRARLARRDGLVFADSDPAESEIEDFDHAENLMIAIAAEASSLPIVRVEERGPKALAAMAAFRAALKALPRV
jgi:nucleoside 2-deoxyribosyltransferase